MLLTLIPSITSIIAVFVSFFLGKHMNQSTEKNKKLEERYNNFYMPLFSKLARISFRNFEEVLQFHGVSFTSFLLDNMQYMSTDSVKYLPYLYEFTSKHVIYESWYLSNIGSELDATQKSDQEQFFNDTTSINLVFFDFVTICSSEADKIAKSLHLEPITQELISRTQD